MLDYQHNGNQSDLLYRWQRELAENGESEEILRIKSMIRFSNPHFELEDTDRFTNFLKKLAYEGCGYIAAVNIIFNLYHRDPRAFKQHYGYAIDDWNAYDRLLIDFYTKEKKRVFWHPGLLSFEIAQALGHYQKLHQAKQLQSRYLFGKEAMKQAVLAGNLVVVTTVLPKRFAPKSSCGVSFHRHTFTVIGIKEGHYIIASWGMRYTLTEDELMKWGVVARVYKTM